MKKSWVSWDITSVTGLCKLLWFSQFVMWSFQQLFKFYPSHGQHIVSDCLQLSTIKCEYRHRLFPLSNYVAFWICKTAYLDTAFAKWSNSRWIVCALSLSKVMSSVYWNSELLFPGRYSAQPFARPNKLFYGRVVKLGKWYIPAILDRRRRRVAEAGHKP